MRIGMMVKALGVFGLLAGAVVAFPASSVDAAQISTQPSTPIGALLATLQNPGTTTGFFGWSVAVSGTTVVVGAVSPDITGGAAYIYVKGASGWPTTPTTKLKDPGASADDYFGGSVALSGSTAVVGAYGSNRPPGRPTST